VHHEAAAILVAEFLNRKWLTDLGYTFGGDEVDILTAEAFVIIGAELQRLGREDNGRQGSNRTRSRG
jgi:hypothetical protein